MVKKKVTKEVEAKVLTIDFHNPNFAPSYFATNIVVQRYEGDLFKVMLYESKPDIILTEEDKINIEKRGTIRADCVGSFIITPAHVKKFITALQNQLSKYEEQKRESTKTSPSSTEP